MLQHLSLFDEEYSCESCSGWMKASVHELARSYLIMLDVGMDRWYPWEGVSWHEGWQIEKQAAQMRERTHKLGLRRFG